MKFAASIAKCIAKREKIVDQYRTYVHIFMVTYRSFRSFLYIRAKIMQSSPKCTCKILISKVLSNYKNIH